MGFENYLPKRRCPQKNRVGYSLTGKLADLAKTYGLDNVTFMGFWIALIPVLTASWIWSPLPRKARSDKAIMHYSTIICLTQRTGFMSLRNGIHIDCEAFADQEKYNEDRLAVSHKVGRNDRARAEA